MIKKKNFSRYHKLIVSKSFALLHGILNFREFEMNINLYLYKY